MEINSTPSAKHGGRMGIRLPKAYVRTKERIFL